MIDTEALKRKILDLAIKGKLVPQDSTDEPASELLKRIKNERDRLIDEGKIKGKKDDFSYIFKGEYNCYYEKELGNLFIPVSTLDKEVKTKETLKVGNIPVISQSLSFIDGYTNSEEKSIKDVPLILFGDHTKIVKYIDFKFCPGADGTKLFKPLDNIYAKYFYYLALYASFNIENRGYGRHSALIKKQIVPVFKNREMQILITYFLDYIFYKIDCITELAKSIDKLKGIIKTKIISLGIQGKLLNSDDNYYYQNMQYPYKPLHTQIKVLDQYRKPVNSNERKERLAKATIKYPYYGATGQAGEIDEYLLDGQYVLIGEDCAPFLDKYQDKAYIVNGKFWVNNHAHILNSTCNEFLCFYLNTFDYHQYVSGTTRLKLTQKDLKRIPYPVLSERIQKQISQSIIKAIKPLDSIT